jgi:hypothetical protein
MSHARKTELARVFSGLEHVWALLILMPRLSIADKFVRSMSDLGNKSDVIANFSLWLLFGGRFLAWRWQ